MKVELLAATRAFLSCDNISDLTEALHRATRVLGFERFAMGHHVDLMTPPDGIIRITNYEPAWIARSLGDGFFQDDPVHYASTRTAAGFLWSEIEHLVALSQRQRMILGAAREYGLCEGYTIPVHVPGEYRGTCSFGADTLQGVDWGIRAIANVMGLYAFEAARKIVHKRSARPAIPDLPKLTDRQRDTLVLVGRGKADSEIAALMGISRATAHEHVENVRRAYGHAQRPNLIARALFDGQISFADVLTGRGAKVWGSG
ncbi:autoinducer binding domain-containing protein [Sphingomonas koreensis]